METKTTSTDLRLSKRELFDALGYKPHAGQLVVHKSKAARRVLCCGARFGKTTCASMEAIAAALAPRPHSVGWVVGPYHEISDRTFLRVVETVKRHFSHRVREYVPREHKLVLVNLGGGISTVRGKSADVPNTLVGEGLDWLVVDEAARIQKRLWDEFLSQRLIDKKGWALLVSTPRGRNWFYREYRVGKKGVRCNETPSDLT